MKDVISARGGSSEKSLSSSTVSGGQTVSKSGGKVLQKLKQKAFDTDIIQLLESDTSAPYGIKDLLKQIDIMHASPEVTDLIMDLGLLIDCVVVDLNRIREALNKIQNKSDTQTAEWEAATKSIAKSMELEKASEKNKMEVEAYDRNIEPWEQKIKELQTNIVKAKECKEELLKLDEDELAKEVQIGMHHVERAQRLGKEIDNLICNKSRWERRLKLHKSKYQKMKDSLPF